MKKQEYFRRYLLLLCGLVVCGFGVAFITKSGLGSSPVASIPFRLSLIIPALTIGNWTILFAMLLSVAQIVLLKKDCNKLEMVVQVGIAFVFGYCIDFGMFCLRSLVPELYAMKIVFLLVGCSILAFGAYLQVVANVAMIPVDAFERTVARLVGKEYSQIRTITDITMSLIAAVLCLVFLHALVGVREGTVIAALITGNIVKLYTRHLSRLTERLNRFFAGSWE